MAVPGTAVVEKSAMQAPLASKNLVFADPDSAIGFNDAILRTVLQAQPGRPTRRDVCILARGVGPTDCGGLG